MKIRTGFVANSSSSSFIICGQVFEKGTDKETLVGPNFTSQWDNGEIIRGVDLGDCYDGFDIPADKFLEMVKDAIEKCKAAGVDDPMIIGRYICDS